MEGFTCFKLVSGELVFCIVANLNKKAPYIVTKNPHIMVNTPQGPALVPFIPWVSKGTEFELEFPSSKIVTFFPENLCTPMEVPYMQATSKLDLASASNVANLRPV